MCHFSICSGSIISISKCFKLKIIAAHLLLYPSYLLLNFFPKRETCTYESLQSISHFNRFYTDKRDVLSLLFNLKLIVMIMIEDKNGKVINFLFDVDIKQFFMDSSSTIFSDSTIHYRLLYLNLVHTAAKQTLISVNI